MKSKSLFYIAILLVVLLGIGTVSASENVTDVDMTLGDSNSGSPVYVDNWADLKSYCESTNDDYTICLNGSFSIDSQIEIKNNVNIIGDANYYIGGTADNVDTYSSVPFLCSDALNVTFTNVNFQYTGGKNLMQFNGNGNYDLENCNFINVNSGSDRSIILSNSGLTNVVDSTFSGCNAQSGVIINNANLLVSNSVFENNIATLWAGAIHTNAYATTNIYDSIFRSNRAGWNGGALYDYGTLYIYNTIFDSNNCTTNNGGGAIGACKLGTSEPYLYVVNSTFINNINKCSQYDSLSTTSLGRGGAISFMDDGTLKVYNNTFINNDAVTGSAICAISQGSYGSPDVEIVGNNFTNQIGPRGSDVLVVSLSNSNYLVENNTYSNNRVAITKYKLDIDDNNGLVTVNVTLRLKHPEYYDSDIITKSGFDVYVDNVYNKTVYDTTFTLNFADSVNHNVKVVPLFSNLSKDKNINDEKYNTIYVSTTGNDNNDGISRNTAVRTISKAIELAQEDVDYIKILEGTYYERSLTIPYEKIIEGEGTVILDGSTLTGNTFNVNSQCEFNNLQFVGITNGMAINGDDNLINITNCSFYSNNVAGKLINAKKLNIENSTICGNVVQYAIYSTGNLNMDNCNVYNNNLTGCTISSTYSIIYASNGLILYNSSLINNNVNKGVLYINGGNNTIKNSQFISNNAKYNSLASYGGAIYGNKADNIIITSSVFYNNYAYTNGGAIYLRNGVNNLNITNSVLVGNTARPSNRNYQIDRQGITSNIFAINNWWGNTIENAYTAPTFYSNNNVNASIWLILNITSNVTSLSSGESALVTFDLTYTNVLGSDSNDTDVTGNLTPFCIDGVNLPVLGGVLTATNGNVNATSISLVDGKASVVFTATSTNPYLTINILDVYENINFNNNYLLLLNNFDDITLDAINFNKISFTKVASKNLLGKGEHEIEENEYSEMLFFDLEIFLYKNCALFYPILNTVDFDWIEEYWNCLMETDPDFNDAFPESFLNVEKNLHFKLSFFNQTSQSWQILIDDEHSLPFPSCYGYPIGDHEVEDYFVLFNFTRGLYNCSIVYDGNQEIEYSYISDYDDDFNPIVEEGSVNFGPLKWEGILDLSGNSYIISINNLNSVVMYENNIISISPKINYGVPSHNMGPHNESDLGRDMEHQFGTQIYFGNYEFTGNYYKDYDESDFSEIKPVNITMTVTQGDKVIKEFSVAPGSTYSLDGLAAGEYNLTAVYDDPYYGYATKTVSLTVNKNIWENVGADEGYSHQTDYFGPKNVEELWNLSLPDNYFNLNDNFQSSVIDSNGNIYVVNGTKILVVNSEGNVIKTLTIESDGNTGLFSRGLALYNNYLICSVYNSAMYGASVWDISNNYAHQNFPGGSSTWGPEGDKKSTTSMYAPVVSNGKVYISSWQYYSDNDHIYEWTTNTHSNPFPRSTGAPSIDSEGYIYVNTKSGLVILDSELNILDLSFGDAGKYGRPVIDSLDMVYVFNSDRTKVYALNRETGLEWNTTIADGACGVMAVDVETNALYIVGNDGILYKLNRANGEMSEFYNLGTNASSILVDARGTIYLGGTDGVLYAVTNEGKTLFKYNIGGTITKDMVLDDNGTLYVYADTKLYALGGAPKLFSEIIINVSDVEVNRNSTIVAILPEDAQGNVTFIIDDVIESGNIEIIGGNATWTAPGLLSGNHTVKVTWVGDSEYFGSTATEEFNAYKVNSTIDLEDSVNYAGKLTQLNITLPEDAVGNVTVTFNRKNQSVEIVNGTATFETTPLEAGNYAIDFSWEGDERYFGNAGYAYFTVIKNDASLTIDAEPIKEGEDLKVTVTLSDDESGMVLIMVGDVKDFAEIKDGKAEFTISGLTADTYDINATYLGDNKYYNTTETSQVTVSAKDTTTIEISPEVITEDDNQSIEVTLPDDATGNVLVEVNGNTFYAEVNGGKVNVPVSGLKANTTYPVTVTYSGNDIYSETTEEGEVTTPEEPVVEPLDPGLELSVQDTVITVSVNDNATGLVIITVGDISFVMDAHELEPIDVSDYLTNGTYDVEVIYLGDEVFMNATDSDKVTVPEEPIIEPLDPELDVDIQNTTITVSINKDATGLVIITVGDISFVFDASELEPVDVSEFLTNGTYPVSVEYLGDDVFDEALFIGGNVTVPSEPVVEPKDAGLNVDIKDTTIAVSINKDATGLVIITVGDISFVFDASELEPVDVSEFLTNGTYPVSVEYLGDDVFDEALFIGGNVTVPSEPVVEPKDAGLKVDIKDTTITVSINENATGLVIISVGDISFVFDASELEPVDVSEFLTNGTYPVSVEYLGDDVFAEKTLIGGKVTVPEEPVIEPKDSGLKVDIKDTVITVSINDDATGLVIITVGDISFVQDAGELEAVDVSEYLGNGTYPVTVTYEGDDVFASANAAGEVTVPEEPVVEPKDPELKATADNNTITTITVTLNKDATGYVLVDAAGEGFYAKVVDGEAVVELHRPGEYDATITYLGDDVFKPANVTISVNVPEEPVVEPKDPNLKAVAANATITVNVDKDATGNVLVDVDGQGYYAPIKNGQATVNIIGLDEGEYQATVTYVGDDVYKSANATVSVTVPKKEDSVPEPVDPKADIKISEDDVEIELPKDATGYLLVDVDGTGYYAPVKDGKASLDLPDLAPGNHTVTVTYTGDKKYDQSNATKTIAVDNPVESIVSENLTKVEKAPDRFEATFTDAEGKALTNTDVKFVISGNTYTRTTDDSGKAGMNINLPAGNYSVTVINPVTNETKVYAITVLPRIESSDLTKYFKNASQFLVKVFDDEGNPVKAGEVVTFNINGVFYNRTTDNNGMAKLSINLVDGKYTITTEYKGCKAANTIEVLPILTAKDITKKYGQAGAFEATLVDGQGKPYANQQVEFNINGVFYKRTTGSNGVAKLNINLQAGEYIITSSYNGFNIANHVTVTA